MANEVLGFRVKRVVTGRFEWIALRSTGLRNAQRNRQGTGWLAGAAHAASREGRCSRITGNIDLMAELTASRTLNRYAGIAPPDHS